MLFWSQIYNLRRHLVGPNQLKTTLKIAPGVLTTWNRTRCTVSELIFLGSTIHEEKGDYNICDRPLTVHIRWDPINLRQRWKQLRGYLQRGIGRNVPCQNSSFWGSTIHVEKSTNLTFVIDNCAFERHGVTNSRGVLDWVGTGYRLQSHTLVEITVKL